MLCIETSDIQLVIHSGLATTGHPYFADAFSRSCDLSWLVKLHCTDMLIMKLKQSGQKHFSH